MRRSVCVLLAALPFAALWACRGAVASDPGLPEGGAGTKCDKPGPGCFCVPAWWSDTTCYSGPPGTAGRGKCKTGTMTCSDDGVLSACVGEVLPSAEVCNGIDDDCDGLVDDLGDLDAGALDVDGALPPSLAGQTVQCMTGKVGLCAYGHRVCQADGTVGCVALAGPHGRPEVCNGLDDDCNGKVDDNLDNLGKCQLADPTLKGECARGNFTCNGGAVSCVAAYTAKAEVCNGLDDNCDGIIDNGALCAPGMVCAGASGCIFTCPHVFAWDGAAFRYESTVGGASLVGQPRHLVEGRDAEFAPMWIRLDSAAVDFSSGAGRARAKILGAEDEVVYLDRARLTVAYHPPGHEVFSTTAMLWAPLDRPDPRELIALRTAALRSAGRASWMGEVDVTAELSRGDERAAPYALDAANFYELDFGPVTDVRHAKLVIAGWKLKLSRGLAPDVPWEKAKIEVKDREGRWVTALVIGSPRGDRKSVVVDLSSVEFVEGRYHMRLWTGTNEGGAAMWYLDRVRLTEEAPAEVRVLDLAASRAELSAFGAPTVLDADCHDHPLWSIDDGGGGGAIREDELTRGRFTRYGDVRELVATADDRLVVMRRGDGVELAFDGIGAPRDGELFTLLLDVELLYKPRVWIEGGISTPLMRQVDPLPYHGMKRYPPPAPHPDPRRHEEYLRAFQTRQHEGSARAILAAMPMRRSWMAAPLASMVVAGAGALFACGGGDSGNGSGDGSSSGGNGGTDGGTTLADGAVAPTSSCKAEGGTAPVVQPAFVRNVKAGETGWFASPAVLDLDGDGKMEIIAALYSTFVFDAQGKQLSKATATQGRVYAPHVVADLDGDGTMEVVVGGNNGTVAAYEYKGGKLTTKAGWPASTNSGGQTPEARGMAAGDLDGDGKLEVVVTTTNTSTTGSQVFVFEPDGTVRAGWPRYNQLSPGDKDFNGQGNGGYGCYGLNVGIGNIDDDPQLEVLVTYDNHQINAFDPDGSSILASDWYTNPATQFLGKRMGWGQFIRWADLAVEDNHYHGHTDPWPDVKTTMWLQWTASPPNVVDLDGDGKNEVVGIPNAEMHDPYETQAYAFMALDGAHDGGARAARRHAGFENLPMSDKPAVRASGDYYPPDGVPAPTTVNIVGDARPEIIAPINDGYVYAIGPDGSRLWRYDYAKGAPKTFASEVVVADLNKDGTPELVFGTYSLAANGGHLVVLANTGALLFDVVLPNQGTNGNGIGVPSAPTIADLDGDGQLEILVQTFDHGIDVFTVPGSGKGCTPWPTARGSLLRSGAGPSTAK